MRIPFEPDKCTAYSVCLFDKNAKSFKSIQG